MDPREADCEVVLVRHAESEWNASGRWQGHADPPLSAAGLEQARALAERVSGERATRLVCSDLQRAVQTAEALATTLGLEPKVDPHLRELDVGTWSGLRREEIAERDPETLAGFESGDPDVRPGGGETRGEIRVRARDAIERLVRAEPTGCLVVVTHLGFIRALLPGEEPGNADWVRVTARDALTRRLLHDAAESEAPSSPL